MHPNRVKTTVVIGVAIRAGDGDETGNAETTTNLLLVLLRAASRMPRREVIGRTHFMVSTLLVGPARWTQPGSVHGLPDNNPRYFPSLSHFLTLHCDSVYSLIFHSTTQVQIQIQVQMQYYFYFYSSPFFLTTLSNSLTTCFISGRSVAFSSQHRLNRFCKDLGHHPSSFGRTPPRTT